MSEEADIQWGKIQVPASKTKVFYSSFFSEGVEYKLYDNVQVYNGNKEPFIGKITKLWEEKQSRTKKVLIRWFLRLRDIDQQMEGDPKELYLAFGKGKGVTNENDLEVICGKMKVLCTSKDARNKQPSAIDLKNADFFFSKIYNVDLQHLSPEKRRIFKELPWEENLQQGLTFGKVLLLQNLDPSLTSADVCEMLKHIFQGVSAVRVIPQETVCPYGQALAIFDSRLLADNALQEMERKCLVLASNKRPIFATKFKETCNLTKFPGHLALEKLKLSRNLGADDYKRAVSTSHSSQPNTIEYEMAIEWRRLQEITQTCQVELFEKQQKEIEEIRKNCVTKDF